jgi:hypothetical protein
VVIECGHADQSDSVRLDDKHDPQKTLGEGGPPMRGMKPSALVAGLLEVQAEVPQLQDAVNPHFSNKYISLDWLMPTILPSLQKHGLLLAQSPSNIDGQPAVRTELIHVASGELIEETMPLILDDNNMQGQGSAITYARRYAAISLLCLDEPEIRRRIQTPRQDAA